MSVAPCHFILATAGHVDHGKSALVKALTGTDPDRLPEEKRRGITIDLGFAYLPLTTADGRQLITGIVDVPGHEDFVRNMIAGVGSIDLGLLMVAADDGWMPQTEEHLQILIYLGVTRMIVAITKSDLGNPTEVAAQVQQKLADTPFAACRILETSVQSNTGIIPLKDAVAAELATVRPAPSRDKPRLCIDRAFTLRGLGTVVTGTLTGGTLHRGQSVLIQPGTIMSRVRSIQSYGHDIETARPGARTALNLPDVEVERSAVGVKRGDVITTLAADSSSTIDVLLTISARNLLPNGKRRLLKGGSIVDVHHGTSRVQAKLILPRESLGSGAESIARLCLAAPLFTFLGDRFVIRDPSQQHTLAGGVVLDPAARRRSFRSEAQTIFLESRAREWNKLTACVASELVRDKIVATSELLKQSPFSTSEIAEVLNEMEADGKIIQLDHLVVDSASWEKLRVRAAELIDESHRDHPELPGLELNAFRSAFRDIPSEAIEPLLNDLCRSRFVRKGQAIARATHQVTLPPLMEPLAAGIRAALGNKPFDPPSRAVIAPNHAAGQTLQFLIEQGEATEISPEVVVLTQGVIAMKDLVCKFISKHGPSTTSQLRQELKTSRRVAVPFLEYLDRHGTTRRIGDQRTLTD